MIVLLRINFLIFLYLFNEVMAANPTCYEDKITAKELDEIAKSESVTDINSFLSSIPEGVLQGFTFVTSSQSLHRGEGEGMVSPMWPRVLRFSTDGKMVISYVCHPKNQTYNQVEVFNYNDEKNKFETVSIDLNKKSTDQHRLKYNQKSCTKCHSYQNPINGSISIKPNWQGYPSWIDCKEGRGISVYGGFDDHYVSSIERGGFVFKGRADSSKSDNPYNCTPEQDYAFFRNDMENFKKFRAKQKDNPCFASLPWTKASNEPIPTKVKAEGVVDNIFEFFSRKYAKINKDSGYHIKAYNEFYPYKTAGLGGSGLYSGKYSRDSRGFNLRLRPNLRLTKALSNLNARRIFQLIKDSPDYNEVKYYIALESAGCLSLQEEEYFEKYLGRSIEKLPPTKWKLSGVDPRIETPLLFSYGKALGMVPGDWSLHFNSKDEPKFRTAIYGTKREELDIHLIVSSLIFNDVTGSSTYQVNDKTPYGDAFSCIDDINKEISSNHGYNGDNFSCSSLRRKFNIYNRSLPEAGPCPQKIQNLADGFEDVEKKVQKIIGAELENSIKRGKELVNSREKGKCVFCHAEPSDDSIMTLPDELRFLSREEDDQFEKDKSFARLKARNQERDFKQFLTHRVLSGEMPLGSSDDLNNTEREDIVRYLQDLLK